MATAVNEYARTDASLSSTRAVDPTTDKLDAPDVPSIETPAYRRSLPRWKKVRDVYQGTEAIRDGGETYLPRFAGESDGLYDARNTIAGFFNGYARTLEAAVGMIMEPPPTLNSDMPTRLAAMWENVDLRGTHGIVFCHDLLAAGINDGFAGIFTDYPRVDAPRNLSLDDERRLGLRPYFILCKSDEVLPVYETVNGTTTLVLFVRRQSATRRKGRFGFETVVYYHVHERKPGATADAAPTITYERWMTREGQSTPQPDLASRALGNLTQIPWSPLVCGQKLGENEYKPTLMDLADLTIEHHRLKTGTESLVEEACVPTKVRVGAPRDENDEYPPLIVGRANVIEIPAQSDLPNPAVYYLSPPVDVLEPGMRMMDNCKAEMGAMGASFLAPDPQQAETATAHALDATAERATIGTIGRRFKDCIELSFQQAGEYINEKGGSLTVNRSFTGEGVSAEDVQKWTTALQAGGISLAEYRHAISTGQLPETFKPDNIRDLLAEGAAPRDNADAGDVQPEDGGAE